MLMAKTFRRDLTRPAKSEGNLLRAGFMLSHFGSQFVEKEASGGILNHAAPPPAPN